MEYCKLEEEEHVEIDERWSQFIDAEIMANIGEFKDGQVDGILSEFFKAKKLNYSKHR